MKVTNSQIATMLRNIASLLSLREGNAFRVMAYEQAATSIEFIDQDLTDIYTNEGIEGLQKIRGIGKSIAQKIKELILTGEIKYYENLKRSVSPAAPELLDIPGVGPKTARRLTDELGIKSIEELPERLNSPEGEKLFGDKTRQRILSGYMELASRTGRLPLYQALPIANEVASALRKMLEVSRVEAAGSIRRRRETAGDIDIVA